MPNWKGHLIFGSILIIISIILNLIFNLLPYTFNINDLIFIPLIFFFALLPDIDCNESKPKFIITIIGILISIYYILVENKWIAIAVLCVLLFVWLLRFFPGFQHRGHIHSIIFILFMVWLVSFLTTNIFILVLLFIAGMSHLIIDQFTGNGAKTLKIW